MSRAREDRSVEGLYEGGGVAERENSVGGREVLTQCGRTVEAADMNAWIPGQLRASVHKIL